MLIKLVLGYSGVLVFVIGPVAQETSNSSTFGLSQKEGSLVHEDRRLIHEEIWPLE